MRKFTLLATASLALALTTNAQTTILSQDFESGALPSGWTRTQASPSVGWEFGNNLGSSYFPIPAHTRYAASNDDAHDNSATTANNASLDRLITPAMDLTPFNGTGVVLKFDYIQPGNFGSSGTIEASTNGGSSWTPLQTVPNSAGWATLTVSLGGYLSSNNLMVAFHHDDGGYWADGMGVDNVVVKSVAANDLAMETVTVSDYVAAGNVNVTGSFSNQGYQTLTNTTVSYSINGGAPVSASLTGLNVTLGSSYSFTHSTPANLSTPGTYVLKVWTSGPNGGTDADYSNDTITKTVNVLSSIPRKNAVLEDHTGAWCQFCPDGTVVAEQVDDNYADQSIVLAVHNNDAMSTADGDAIANEYISGYPGGLIDHFLFPSESDVEINRGIWDARMGDRLNYVVPAGVSFEDVSWDPNTRQITATVRADFFGNASGDIRMNLIVAEDSVVGTGSGYNQVNYYNTQSGHPFFGAGNPILGFVHDHVARAFLGGSWGQAGIIPASVSDGDNFSHTFTYTLPASYRWNKVKLVALIQRYNNDPKQREIINAEEVTLEAAVGLDNTTDLEMAVNAFPNPFSSYTQIDFNLPTSSEVVVDVVDMYGKTVAQLNNSYMGQGMHSLKWHGASFDGAPAANGVYMIVFKYNGKTQIEKVVLNR